LPAASVALGEGMALSAILGPDSGDWIVWHTPGHSAGSVCLYSSAEKTLVSGDTLFNAGFGRTDLPGGDLSALEASLTRLMALSPETVVLPGHGEPTTIGAEFC
jgi:glyoxylase-like metal-dependent hydrolase (beta-lactamase superfamily II)